MEQYDILTYWTFLEQEYKKQELKSGCAVKGGIFHQRCVCKAHVTFCKKQCDANPSCKGYVGPVFNEVTGTNGCQFATITAKCPGNCSLLDEGVGVDTMLTREEQTPSDGYPGCFMKKTRMLKFLYLFGYFTGCVHVYFHNLTVSV